MDEALFCSQWSNYEGARGGLAPLKDRMAPSKHLVWEGTRGPLKGPHEITHPSNSIHDNATYQYHSKHRWCCNAACTVPGYMIDKPCSIFFVRRNQRCRLKTIVAVHTCAFSSIQIAQHIKHNIVYPVLKLTNCN